MHGTRVMAGCHVECYHACSHSMIIPMLVIPQVFLGGACNPTTWRRDIAIPMLTTGGIGFYNPQVDDWTAELVILEALAKGHCEILM